VKPAAQATAVQKVAKELFFILGLGLAVCGSAHKADRRLLLSKGIPCGKRIALPTLSSFLFDGWCLREEFVQGPLLLAPFLFVLLAEASNHIDHGQSILAITPLAIVPTVLACKLVSFLPVCFRFPPTTLSSSPVPNEWVALRRAVQTPLKACRSSLHRSARPACRNAQVDLLLRVLLRLLG